MSTLIQRMAEYAVSLQFEDLPAPVVHQVKRFLLDSLGCAFGGSITRDVQIFRDYYESIGGTPEASVINAGIKLPCAHAALLNSLMIRALDYNDIYWESDPSHPSDLIPAVLAPAEVYRKNGRDVITALVLAYEFEQRLCEIAHPGIRERKWHHATLTSFAAPIAAGKIMGLDRDRIVHAVGISGSHQATFGAVTAGHLTMMKNTVDPLAVQGGVVSAELAGRGYEGPAHVIDGKEGLADTLTGGTWDVEGLVRGLGEDFRILRCSMKAYPTEALTHSPFSALQDVLQRDHITVEAIDTITVRTIARAVDILADPTKYHPATRETADHSLPYCIAVLVLDGRLTPEQFTEERIQAPDIRALLPKIRVVAEPRYEALFPAMKPAGICIALKNGQRLESEVQYPKGDYRNPLSDDEIIQKITPLMCPHMRQDTCHAIIDAVWHLDECTDLTQFMELLSLRNQQGN